MVTTVIPISFPLVDWNNFLKFVHNVSSRSPTKLLDSEHKPIGDLYSYIGAIGYFAYGKTPDESIRYCPSILNHLFFTFIIEVDDKDFLITLLKETNLKVTDNSVIDRDVMYIVSGTLLDWKNAIVVFTHRSKEERIVFDKIFYYFQSLGLQDVFFNNAKTVFDDKTFRVENEKVL